MKYKVTTRKAPRPVVVEEPKKKKKGVKRVADSGNSAMSTVQQATDGHERASAD